MSSWLGGLLKWFLGLPGMAENKLMRCPRRCGHIAFSDGENLYVWGGHCKDGNSTKNPAIDELWIFSNKFDAWAVKKCTGVCPHGTSGASYGVVYPNLYVYGGHNLMWGHVNSMRILNLRTFEWLAVETKGPLMSPRDKAASWVYEEKLWCFGGYGPDPEVTGVYHRGQGSFCNEGFNMDGIGWNNQLAVYDPMISEWSSPKSQNSHMAPLPRAAHTVTVMGDTVYVFGGRHMDVRMNDLHSLNLRTLTWSGKIQTAGSEPVGRSWHTLSRLDDDRMVLFGGFSQHEDVLSDLWTFSVSEARWTSLLHRSHYCRGWHTAVVTNSKDVLVFGGFNKNILALDFDIYHVSDKIVKFQFNPLSLKQLCLAEVYSGVAQEHWAMLPDPLQEWLGAKLELQASWLSLSKEEAQRHFRVDPHVLHGFRASPTGDEIADGSEYDQW